jgi:hypothetical protein
MLVDFITWLIYYEPSEGLHAMRRQQAPNGARFVTEGRWVGP